MVSVVAGILAPSTEMTTIEKNESIMVVGRGSPLAPSAEVLLLNR